MSFSLDKTYYRHLLAQQGNKYTLRKRPETTRSTAEYIFICVSSTKSAPSVCLARRSARQRSVWRKRRQGSRTSWIASATWTRANRSSSRPSWTAARCLPPSGNYGTYQWYKVYMLHDADTLTSYLKFVEIVDKGYKWAY